jgi:tellurite resistance protein
MDPSDDEVERENRNEILERAREQRALAAALRKEARALRERCGDERDEPTEA